MQNAIFQQCVCQIIKLINNKVNRNQKGGVLRLFEIYKLKRTEQQSYIMLSLHDKIQKFTKLTYSKQLQQFIPLDDQFISSGITISSLIKQNAFIIQQIKKIKNVFTNYCKLNQNVYQKITQHQLNLQKQNQRIRIIVTDVDRKMEDIVKDVKGMHQGMQYQVKKQKNMMQQTIQPIICQLNLKVQRQIFDKQIKKIINQIDGDINDEQQILDSQGNPIRNTTNDVEIDGNQRKKKSKYVSFDEYQQQKQKNMLFMQNLSINLQKVQSKSTQHDNLLYKNTSSINNLVQLTQTHENENYQTKKQLVDLRKIFTLSEQSLLSQISKKTCDSVWQKKLSDFQIISITPICQILSKSIQNLDKQNLRKFIQLQPKFDLINSNLSRLQTKSQQNKQKSQTIQSNITKNKDILNERLEKIDQKIDILQKSQQQHLEKLNNKINTQNKVLTNNILNLKQTIDSLSRSIQQTVLKNVNKTMNVKMKEIQDQLKMLNRKDKEKTQQGEKIQMDISNIKQIVSKKANFTDLLMNFQKKADRVDMTQLKQKVLCLQTSPSNNLKSTILGYTQQSPIPQPRRSISSHSRRKATGASIRRLNTSHLISSFNVSKHPSISINQQDQIRSGLFLVGLDEGKGFIQSGKTTRRNSVTGDENKKKRREIKRLEGNWGLN